MKKAVKLTVRRRGAKTQQREIPRGSNLRAALLAEGFSPYQGRFRQLNCKGLGLCGSCKVLVTEGSELWERRACQMQCYKDLEIELQ